MGLTSQKRGDPKMTGRGCSSKKFVSVLAALAILTVFIVPEAAGKTRFTISVGGGFERVFSYGSESDYSAGLNDFPVTPGHTTGAASLELAYGLTERLDLTLEGRYGFSGTIRLSDPSDGDVADISTAKRWSLALGIRYFLAMGRIRPWLSAGAGLERLLAEEQSALSEFGFVVVFSPPENPYALLASAGAGLEFALSEAFGFWVGLRYVRVFSRPNAVGSLIGGAGLSFAF